MPTSASTSRVACTDVAALPLQLVLREHPDWQSDPVVVVEDDRPMAIVLWVNQAARALRIFRGSRFNQAQALSAKLRAVHVPQAKIEAAINEIQALLLLFSPRVEPERRHPGLFFLDASGLGLLYPTIKAWAQKVQQALAQRSLTAAVVVGFQRYRTLAIARHRPTIVVLRTVQDEARLANEVPLTELDISPKLVTAMGVLGVNTLGDFLRLPASDLATRYGPEAAHVHAQASGTLWTPLQPESPVELLTAEIQLEPPDDDLPRLLFRLKETLHGLVERLSVRCEAAIALELTVELDHQPTHHQRIETAAPTLDVMQLIELARLRLTSVQLAAAVTRIGVELQSTRVHPQQLALLLGAPQRDLEAAARALARIKAAFGDTSVTRAHLLDRHLPEASFCWEPIARVQRPCLDAPPTMPPLVRQLYREPQPLPPIPAHEPERWLGAHGAVTAMHGPYRTSGGWWVRRVERDYYFIETKTTAILWVYYDRQQRRWYLHGIVD